VVLTPGRRLGAYEIVSTLGAGGMGEVYRARDTTLNRDVALKVLPELFALDPDRLSRFKREAQVLAALNHPNIAAIYGFEATAGAQALALELVEGPTLADRIAQGPIPLDEALPIARQIAEALEAAHEHGIIHRDLKPANIKVRPDGTVKVLDFGLAKALQGDVVTADVSQSPTLSLAATRMGVILGTAAYMAPEQAKGRAADKRSDIWAFGCVLFEMLTGRHAFAGETITDILVSVMTKDPDWQQLPSATPLRLRQLLTRSLRKDVRARLQHAGDARIEIADILAEPGLAGESRTAGTRPRRTAVTFALTAVATAALSGIVVWSIVRPRELAVPAVTRVRVICCLIGFRSPRHARVGHRSRRHAEPWQDPQLQNDPPA
jgi:serine/threonine-protein kinase